MKRVEGVPVSIIVPAYNVEEWIDECLKSIVTQTFGDFEVLLINDESTDGTQLRCETWAQNDSRIKFFNVKHGGLSAARNFGIEKSEGEYLLFVDSDDWLDTTFVEKMYNAAIGSHADIVECDFWRYNNVTGEKTYRPCYGRMGVPYTQIERLLYGESVAWKCIFKKKIWVENKVEFPNCLGASHVTYVLFILLGMKFFSIREPLYYYRRMRKGSIIDNNGKGTSEEGRFGTEEIELLISELKKRKLFDTNIEIIQRAIKYRFSDLLAAQYGKSSKEAFQAQRDCYYELIQKRFSECRNDKYVMVGGYNLNRILSYIDEIQDPLCRFNFSGIISLVNPTNSIGNIHHRNSYREKMIVKDVQSLLWETIKQVNPRFIFWDLIDDRYEIAKVKSGYITYSDAFKQAEFEGDIEEILSPDSEDYISLWEKSVDILFEKLFLHFSNKQIVIIENYLCERHGTFDANVPYVDANKIKRCNDLLKKKYKYIKEHYSGLSWISAYMIEPYYTDDEYEYGVYPEHVNEYVNKLIAKEIDKGITQIR